MLLHSVIRLHISVAWLELHLNGILRINSLCVVKFLWICSTPAGMIRVSDQVRPIYAVFERSNA